MPAYKYQQGDRPLDGYTIEYGLGRGGFGEVYYAVSDAGRQVALKSVLNYEDIELRGIRHCMNLKSPHLVTIFDVKHNSAGEPFVIMEFVSGPSLRDLLDESPDGLGETKTAYFLREIAKGLAYLHDNGIVHRDLKPHNVFYEDGFVKIGDYSLSKALTASHRSGHTVTVGTVHYMAPEISMGRYDSRVDIYALGIMLYEMVRGTPPFVGESMGEVLMKHVAVEVNVEGIAEPFASVIKKALAKDPAGRFQTATEMAGAVFGDQHIEYSVAEFNPQHLTQVARRVGQRVAAGGISSGSPQPPSGSDAPTEYHPDSDRPEITGSDESAKVESTSQQPTTPAYRAGQNLGWIRTHSGLRFEARRGHLDPASDTIQHPQRMTLAGVSAVAISSACFVAPSSHSSFTTSVANWLVILSVILGGAMGIYACGRWLADQRTVPVFARRLAQVLSAAIFSVVGLIAAAFPIWLTSGYFTQVGLATVLVAPLLPVFMLDWREMYSPLRRRRISLLPILVAAGLAGVAALLLEAEPTVAAGVAAGIAIAVQAGSPFAQRRVTTTGHPQAEEARSERHAPAVPRSSSDAAFSDAGLSDAEGLKAEVSEAQVSEAQVSEAAVAAIVVDAPSISPRSRAVALILAVLSYFTGVCGLQRFYAGKIGTAFLYLLTFGLCGIGQLIDAVIILMGQFTDEQGRLIESWQGIVPRRATSQPVNAWSSVPSADPISRQLVHLIGLILLAHCVAGAVVAVSNPPRAEMTQSVVILSLAAVFVSALAVLLLARRHQGIAHVMRAVVGSGICLASVFVLGIFLRQLHWAQIAELLSDGQPVTAIHQVVGSNDRVIAVLVSGAAMLLGVVFLIWPAAAPHTRSDPAVSGREQP